MRTPHHLFTLALFFTFSSVSVEALNVGIQAADTAISVSKECSRTCESEFCSVPPFLRYGKYCGLLYSGCPGEKPCDGLDACCMKHDDCVQAMNSMLPPFPFSFFLSIPIALTAIAFNLNHYLLFSFIFIQP
uniref:phospholipase A2 n=1 Tax=Gossypium raimondii TaxID=29730 RepID=A0A0D2TGL9_GOSRA|nr:hypothetical protein B456_009G001900 [Gossypium raimondii]